MLFVFCKQFDPLSRLITLYKINNDLFYVFLTGFPFFLSYILAFTLLRYGRNINPLWLKVFDLQLYFFYFSILLSFLLPVRFFIKYCISGYQSLCLTSLHLFSIALFFLCIVVYFNILCTIQKLAHEGIHVNFNYHLLDFFMYAVTLGIIATFILKHLVLVQIISPYFILVPLLYILFFKFS